VIDRRVKFLEVLTLINVKVSIQSNMYDDIAPKIKVPKDMTEACNQFHQHFTSRFCANIFAPKNYKANM